MSNSSYRRILDEVRRNLSKETRAPSDWILSLKEIDEPPIFSRSRQVRSLGALPLQDRICILLHIAMSRLCDVAKCICDNDVLNATWFTCITLMDFDMVAAGDQLVPTVSLLVDPNDCGVLPLCPSYSHEAKLVERSVEQLSEDSSREWVVAELGAETEPELKRIYVGFRMSPCVRLRSVGSELTKGIRTR